MQSYQVIDDHPTEIEGPPDMTVAEAPQAAYPSFGAAGTAGRRKSGRQ
jgi:hypothetical protein